MMVKVQNFKSDQMNAFKKSVSKKRSHR